MSTREKLIASGKLIPAEFSMQPTIRQLLIDRGIVKPNPGMTPQQAYRALLADWYKGAA